MSFLQKVRALTVGAAHDLVDKGIEMNSPTVVRQYVRDLEGAIDKLKTESAVQDGQLMTTRRQISELNALIEEDKAKITKLLMSSDPNAAILAKSKGATVVANQQRISQMNNDCLTQQNVATSMQDALAKLNTRHAAMVQQVRELERLDLDSKAKESAATAITNAGKIAGMTSDGSVDDLKDHMQRRHDVANAKFDQAVGSMPVDEPVDTSDVDALLASLKPQLQPTAQ